MFANWSLSETGFDPRQLRWKETIFTIGNGSFCTRGSFEESYPGETPATLAGGLYDDIPTFHSELVNLPNWLWLQVCVDGEPFRMDRGELLSYNRTLDLYSGCLRRQVVWRSPSKRMLEMEWERWISLADPHALGMRFKARALDFSGSLELRAGLNGWTGHAGMRHWELLDQGALEKAGGFLHLRTKSSHMDICQAFALDIQSDGVFSIERDDTGWAPGVRLITQIDPGQAFTVDKLVSLFTSHEVPEPVVGSAGGNLVRATTSHLDRLAGQGYDQLRADSAAAWSNEWKDCAVAIEGDPEVELAVRFSLFQLLIAAPRFRQSGSIGARGLSGFGYHGHVFWDAELYVLPFFLYTRPEVARRMLLYRYSTLPGARAKAQEKGWEGSMFAWESAATGEESTPRWVPEPNGVELERIWSGDLSLFTTAGVAWAVNQYWQVTGDDPFIKDFGAEIILDTARFWEQRVEWNPEIGCYELKGVIGPDEFHLHVDNNAFTNHLARWNLKNALKVWDWLGCVAPAKAVELETSLGLTAARFQKWKHIIENIVIQIDPETQLIEQFDGYFKLSEIDLEAYEPRLQSIQVILGLQRSQQMQVTRQPDVLLMLFLFKDLLDRKGVRSNWDYYAQRTDLTHGSSLGYSVHAGLAARLGEVESAYQSFKAAAAIDLADTFGNTGQGIHTGNAGGIWQALVLGFAGLEVVGGEGYVLHPCLPQHWKKLVFSICIGGKRHKIEILNPSPPHIPPGSETSDAAVRVGSTAATASHLSPILRVDPESRRETGDTSPLSVSLAGMAFRGLNDPRRTMLAVDSYCFNLTGLHPAELVRSQLYGTLIHPHDRDYVLGELQNAQREKRAYVLVYRILTAAQREKWVWETGRALPGEEPGLLEGRMIELTGRNTEYEALSEYAERLEGLREIDQAILAACSSSEVVQIALRALRRLAPAVRHNLILLNFPDGQAELFSLMDRSQELITRSIQVTPELSRRWSALGGGARDERLLISRDDFEACFDSFNDEIAGRFGACNQLVPLRSQETLVGLLALGAEEPGVFTESPLNIADELANSLAVAITQRRLLEQVNSANQSLKRLSRRLVDVQEQERRSLARELHDEIGQALTAIKMSLEGMASLPAVASRKRLEDSIQVIDQTLQQVRNLSLDLRPALLDELGLAATLRWYVDRLAQWNGIEAQFQSSLRQERLPSEIETTLFRVSQEALTNVLRHSGAKRVVVLLLQTSDQLILQVRDNGRGFQVGEAIQAALMGNSLGLLGIQERLHLIGGQLKIHSSPGMGCEISAEVPYPAV